MVGRRKGLYSERTEPAQTQCFELSLGRQRSFWITDVESCDTRSALIGCLTPDIALRTRIISYHDILEVDIWLLSKQVEH